MASKKFYHEINLSSVGQLLNSRVMNITTAEEESFIGRGTLGESNKGLIVYNTDDGRIKTWNGAGFDSLQIDVSGDVKFKGLLDASVSLESQVHFATVPGSQYIITKGGALSYAGLTFSPSGVVEAGDMLLIGNDSVVHVIQRNDLAATNTVAGNIEIATFAETLLGENDEDAITPATLSALLNNKKVISQSVVTVNLPAKTPVTISHNLGLDNMYSFAISLVKNSMLVGVDVKVVDENTVTVTSLETINGVTVTIHGFSNKTPGGDGNVDPEDPPVPPTTLLFYSFIIAETSLDLSATAIAFADE